MRDLVRDHHCSVGGVLCGLQVKLGAWNENFHDGRGGSLQRADFVVSDLRQGLETIVKIEAEAPKMKEFAAYVAA